MEFRQAIRAQTETTLSSFGPRLAGLAMIALLFACRAAEPEVSPTPLDTATPELARIAIASSPSGASVIVDGMLSGYTPLELALVPSTAMIRLELIGYASVERTVQLAPGQTLALTETLRDTVSPLVELAGLGASTVLGEKVSLYARATDNAQVVNMRLFIDGSMRLDEKGTNLKFEWETAGEEAGVHMVRVEAMDADANVGAAEQQLLLLQPVTPTSAPTPVPSPTPTPAAHVYETELNIPTYPYASYLHQRLDSRYHWGVLWLDRAAYEASRPGPQPLAYHAVVLENRFLRLTFLPELGGRLYQCLVKSTGQGLFYQNPVIKPSYWGPLGRNENWWLAAGGMEWALPVQEHGYDWGVPWTYRTASSRQGASIILTNSAGADHVVASITVTLPAESCSFRIEPRLTNPTSQPQALQFWINAALTLGSPTATANTHFVVPADRAMVHSTGDSSLPGERQTLSWPAYNGRDLSLYGNWSNWLGVFFPEAAKGYLGAYSEDTGLGVARVYPPEVAPGCKLFGFGADFPARAEYSDDGSQYFELWGGPCRSFWAEDDRLLAAGESISWKEVWLPFTGLGGISYASEQAVVYASLKDSVLHLAIASARASNSELTVSWNDEVLYQKPTALDPTHPAALSLPLPSGASVPGDLQVDLSQGGVALLTFADTLNSQ